MFLLGIFTKRANGIGVLVGAAAGSYALYLVKTQTQMHVYLYALIGIIVSVSVGCLVSLLIPVRQKPLQGLTIHTVARKSGQDDE